MDDANKYNDSTQRTQTFADAKISTEIRDSNLDFRMD